MFVFYTLLAVLALVGVIMFFALGLAASVVGFVGKLVFSIAGFGLKFTLKTVLGVVAFIALLLFIIF